MATLTAMSETASPRMATTGAINAAGRGGEGYVPPAVEGRQVIGWIGDVTQVKLPVEKGIGQVDEMWSQGWASQRDPGRDGVDAKHRQENQPHRDGLLMMI